MLKCGIVILNINDKDRVINLVNSIKDYQSIHRIVIVDNHSTDGSYEAFLKKYTSSKINIVSTDDNKGYSYGNNIGIRILLQYGDVDIIAIANTDVEFSNQFIEKLLYDFEDNEEFGMLTGLQLAPDKRIAVHPFWGCNTTIKNFLIIRLSQLIIPNKLFYIKNPDSKYIKEKLEKYNSLFEVENVEGSLFLIRTSLFENIGLFDENVFLYCEEDIISCKIKKQSNYLIGVDPTVTYIHYGGQITKKLFSNIEKIKLLNKSYSYLLRKYISDNIVLRVTNEIINMLIIFEAHLRNIRDKILTSLKKE